MISSSHGTPRGRTLATTALLTCAAIVLAGCAPGAAERPSFEAIAVDSGTTGVLPLGSGNGASGGSPAPTTEQIWSLMGQAFANLPVDESTGWLVINYQAASNDLEAAIVKDAWETLAVSQPGVTMLTLIDRVPTGHPSDRTDADTLPGIPEAPNSGTQVLRIQGGKGELLANLPDLNMSDSTTLTAFIAEAAYTYPNRKVAIFLADHASGWAGLLADDETTGGPTYMGLDGLDRALSEGLRLAGRTSVDLIGIDACLVANVDVMDVIAKHTPLFLASPELVPGEGNDYGFLAGVSATTSPEQFGLLAIDAFEAFYTTPTIDQYVPSATLGLFDMTKYDALANAVAYLASVGVVNDLNPVGLPASIQLAVAGGRANLYGATPDRTGDTDLVDLGNIADVLQDSPDPLLSAAAAGVAAALEDLTIAYFAGEQHYGSSGVNVYLPQNAARMHPNYANVVSGNAWSQFLGELHARIDHIDLPNPFEGASQSLQVQGDNLVLSVGIPAGIVGFITRARAEYGQPRDDGSVIYLLGARISADQTPVLASVPQRFASVRVTGASPLPVYFDLTTRTAQFLYTAPNGTRQTVVVSYAPLDRPQNTRWVPVGIAIEDATGMLGRGELDPAGRLDPMARVRASSGSVSWQVIPSATGIPADLEDQILELNPIPSGNTGAFGLELELANGELNRSVTSFTIP